MIKFSKLTIEDIPAIIKWIRSSHVIEYWDSAQNVDDIHLYNKYTKRLNEDDIDTYIIQITGKSIGLIQTYFVDDLKPFKIFDIAKGIDLFIGEVDYINKGYGTDIMKRFLQHQVFNDETVRYACIDPEVANERAIRVYEKVGFQIVNIAYDNHSKLLTCYMILKREDFFDYYM